MLPMSLLVVSAFLVGPVGVADDKLVLEREHPLYPLKAGIRWNSIEKTPFNGEIKKCFEEVTEIVKFDEFTCAKLKTSDWETTYLMVKDDGGLYRVGGQDQNDTYTYEPHWCILKPISQKTQLWDYEYRPISTGGLGPTFYQVMHGRAAQFQEQIEYEGKMVDATCVRLENAASTFRTWYLPGKGPIKADFRDTDKLDKVNTVTTVTSIRGIAPLAIGDVELNPGTIEREASSESVEALPGVVTELKKSRTIKRQVQYSLKLGLEAEVQAKLTANLFAVKTDLTARVKGRIEQTTGEILSDTETREQSVKLDGNVIQKAKIVWIDVYRTGTVDVTQDGKSIKVPFEFPIGTKLVVQKP